MEKLILTLNQDFLKEARTKTTNKICLEYKGIATLNGKEIYVLAKFFSVLDKPEKETKKATKNIFSILK